MIDAIGGVKVASNDPRDESNWHFGQQVRGDEVGERAGGRRVASDVMESDEVVCLAAPETGFNADNRGVRALTTCQTAKRFSQQAAQALGWVGVLEEGGRITVHGVGIATEDASKRCGELLFAQLSSKNLVARAAGVEDGSHGPCSLLSLRGRLR